MKVLKKILKILGFIVGTVVAIYLVLAMLNVISSLTLKNYIRSFDKVEYANQLTPTVGEDGHYTFTTDGDFKIMQLNDLHIGGGHWSLKKDKKTMYEVMTMVQVEKPDLIVLNGDSVFCVPGPMFGGGSSFNNRMASKRVIDLFEKLGVYYTVAFGNHDTEAYDYFNRKQIGDLYMKDKYEYCIFQSEFNDYGVTNQCIVLRGTDNSVRKAIMVFDSNDYIDTSFAASMNWLYDVIHDEQVAWAKQTLLSLGDGVNPAKSLFFFHIPTGEFEQAYRDLKNNNFNDTADVKYISGVWDELVDEDMGGRIWYGGCHNLEVAPNDNDKLFEQLGPDGINSLEAIFCGHDHVNNAMVNYKGVILAYGMSLDNTAYKGINKSGLQRGAMVVTVKNDNTFTVEHKNAYLDYGVDQNKFYDVYLDKYLYPDYAPTNR